MLSPNLSPRSLAGFVAAVFLAASLFGPFANASREVVLLDGEPSVATTPGEAPDAAYSMRFEHNPMASYNGWPVNATLVVSNPDDDTLELKIGVAGMTDGWSTDFRGGAYKVAANGTLEIPVKFKPPRDGKAGDVGRLEVRARSSAGLDASEILTVKIYSPHPGQKISMELAPEAQRAHAGDRVVYKLIVTNRGPDPAALHFEAFNPEHKVKVWMDERGARFAEGETRTFAVHVATPHDIRPGNLTIVVVARHADATTASASNDVAGKAHARLVIVGDKVCCEKPIRGHATGNGYRIFVPLEEGRHFDLPIRVSGHVKDGMLVLDIAVEGPNHGSAPTEPGRPYPRPTEPGPEPQPAAPGGEPTHPSDKPSTAAQETAQP